MHACVQGYHNLKQYMYASCYVKDTWKDACKLIPEKMLQMYVTYIQRPVEHPQKKDFFYN